MYVGLGCVKMGVVCFEGGICNGKWKKLVGWVVRGV